MTPCGSVSVAGTIKNQYSLDEYENILRVATTTGTIQGSNASLYCIDLSTWKTVAAVENFAPYGETVRSVRFDKNKAYVCTAVELTDPVFSFDLTDLDHIVVKDTGTISGYSTSLVNFGAYLLGIGIGSSSDTLKIELYEESGDEVSSVAVYEVPGCSFLPSDYKSYYINREDMQLGIAFAVYDTNGTEMYPENYVLLQFDGYGFAELIHVALNGVNDNVRAFAKDGYFYIFDSGIVVKPLF